MQLPLPTLLSHALVAFIIEFDNEFEHQMPHRTSNHGATPGHSHAPWLVSMAMWTKFMQFIPSEGISASEWQALSGITSKERQNWFTRLQSWGYLAADGDKASVRPSAAGRQAQDIWRPLTATIEKRWQERFGVDEITDLKESLSAVAGQLSADLPDYLPILGYGLYSKAAAAPPDKVASRPTLPSLLSKVLLAFAVEFESESEVSLAISANVLRLAGEAGVRVRDLPRLAAVSKEAIATSLSFLEKRGYAIAEPEAPGSRNKLLKLTTKGLHAQSTYRQQIASREDHWRTQLAKDSIHNLRKSLERVDGGLLPGLQPYPDNWRASLPKPEDLPHYPMVWHRGGFPDGS